MKYSQASNNPSPNLESFSISLNNVPKPVTFVTSTLTDPPLEAAKFSHKNSTSLVLKSRVRTLRTVVVVVGCCSTEVMVELSMMRAACGVHGMLEQLQVAMADVLAILIRYWEEEWLWVDPHHLLVEAGIQNGFSWQLTNCNCNCNSWQLPLPSDIYPVETRKQRNLFYCVFIDLYPYGKIKDT